MVYATPMRLGTVKTVPTMEQPRKCPKTVWRCWKNDVAIC